MILEDGNIEDIKDTLQEFEDGMIDMEEAIICLIKDFNKALEQTKGYSICLLQKNNKEGQRHMDFAGKIVKK